VHTVVPKQVACPGKELNLWEFFCDRIQCSIVAGIVDNEYLELAVCQTLDEKRV